MLKIQVAFCCGGLFDHQALWLFPGNKEELVNEWKKAQVPGIFFSVDKKDSFHGELISLKQDSNLCFAGILPSEEEAEAVKVGVILIDGVIALFEHNADGDHIHQLTLDGEKFMTLHEKHVYAICWPLIPEEGKKNLVPPKQSKKRSRQLSRLI